MQNIIKKMVPIPLRLFLRLCYICVKVTFLLKFTLTSSHFSTPAQCDYRYWFPVLILLACIPVVCEKKKQNKTIHYGQKTR